MADDSPIGSSCGDVAIVGGGCYGTFYAGQLLRARERGKATYRRLLVVDRDPGCRFAAEIGAAPTTASWWWPDWERLLRPLARPPRARGDAGPDDAIVPSPLMPHLMYEWLVRRARARWPGAPVEQRR